MNKTKKIPRRSIWSSLIALAIIVFAYIQLTGFIIPGFKEIRGLTNETITISHINLIWIPIISYLIIGTFIYMVVTIFKKPKPYKEKGLLTYILMGILGGFLGGFLGNSIWGLLGGLLGGFIGCILFGFIGSFVGSLLNILTWEYISDFLRPLIGAISWGLIVGLIVGLIWASWTE